MPGVVLPRRDVRARTPQLVRAAMRFELLRAAARVAALVAIDVAGVLLAITTAVELKAVLLGHSQLAESFQGALDFGPLACLVTLLLFARSDLYAERAARPGPARIIASLFQVTVVILIYSVAEGAEYSSYYIFYGSLAFSVAYVGGFRWLFDKLSARPLWATG